MTFDQGHFINFKKHSGTVTIANGKTLQVRGGGTIEVPIQGKMTQITGVIYVPDLGYNLLSVSQLGEKGMKCNFDSSSATLLRNGQVVAIARKLGRTYVLEGSANEKATLASVKKDQEVSARWHRRLGHPGMRKTDLFGSGAVDGIPPLQQVNCETCKMTKSTQNVNRSLAPRATQKLERVHMDFWGPYKTPTIGGSRYMLTVTDDFSRKSWIYLTKERSEVYQVFESWRNQAQLESGQKLKALRSDNAPEFIKLSKELEKDGIRTELTVPYTPSQNGVAERLNRTLITKARAMLVTAELPSQLWGEAVHAACYLKNLTPMNTDRGPKSPDELWTGKRPRLSHLRVFGCIAFAYLPPAKRDKLDKTSFKGVFVGYSQTARQYRILNPIDMTVKRFSSVEFDELQKGGPLLKGDRQASEEQDSEILLDFETTSSEDRNVRESSRIQENAEELTEPNDNDDDANSNIDVYRRPTPEALEEEQAEPYRTIEGRPQRSRRMPRRYENAVALQVNYSPSEEPVTPNSFEEAVHGRESRKWKLAIEDQLRSLEANHTWEVVDKPNDVNLISTKWVFKVKMLPNGQIDKYKARLCARGFTQEYGVDYFETFAPVIQMDVVSAYLLGDLEEEAYIEVPKGLDLPHGKALKLTKGMPGLKQSGRVWNKKITDFFEEHGLKSLPADHSVFANEERTLIVALYVDDLLLFSRTVEEIQPLKEALSSAFEMKDLGEAKYVLGISITRNRSKKALVIDQEHYVRDLLQEHGLDDGRTVKTPVEGYSNLVAVQQGDPLTDIKAYQRLLGKLNWLVRACRPDVAFVVQKLSQFSHNPGAKHMGEDQRLLRYLSGTRKYGIKYTGRQGLAGYTDSDYAADKSRRSTMGYIFLLAQGAVTWSSKMQRSVSTSTAEAEYHALAYAGKEAVWIRNLLGQLGFTQKQPTTVYGDNQGALALSENPEFHARTKHIDVSAHYIRELVEDQIVKLEYKPTDGMLADCLTKPLKAAQHQHIVKSIGIQEWR